MTLTTSRLFGSCYTVQLLGLVNLGILQARKGPGTWGRTRDIANLNGSLQTCMRPPFCVNFRRADARLRRAVLPYTLPQTTPHPSHRQRIALVRWEKNTTRMRIHSRQLACDLPRALHYYYPCAALAWCTKQYSKFPPGPEAHPRVFGVTMEQH